MEQYTTLPQRASAVSVTALDYQHSFNEGCIRPYALLWGCGPTDGDLQRLRGLTERRHLADAAGVLSTRSASSASRHTAAHSVHTSLL